MNDVAPKSKTAAFPMYARLPRWRYRKGADTDSSVIDESRPEVVAVAEAEVVESVVEEEEEAISLEIDNEVTSLVVVMYLTC